MIISKIIGGLGNQMFQYAIGRALSLDHDQSLRLDVSEFDNYRLHQGFELQRIFSCQSDIACRIDVRNILGWPFSPSIRKLLKRKIFTSLRSKGYIIEPHYHFWAKIKNVPPDCYLDGYWQSEKYFQDIISVIRTDFTFKPPLTNRNAVIVKHISQHHSVSLHVRRGDYASDTKTNNIHGLCSLDYYRNAIQYVTERIRQPFFYIFSDDISWVKKNIIIDLPCQYIDHNRGMESYNDMRLMSVCQHHIIANSSFSWWGAWLNPCPQKIVVAPHMWFINNNNVKDLFPPGWVTL